MFFVFLIFRLKSIGFYDIMKKDREDVMADAFGACDIDINAVLRLIKSYWRLIMAELKCNECGVSGVKYIVSTKSNEQSKGGDAWFNIVYCESCGHIYGVFAKHILSHEITSSIPQL